jgi:hypothetical protein
MANTEELREAFDAFCQFGAGKGGSGSVSDLTGAVMDGH